MSGNWKSQTKAELDRLRADNAQLKSELAEEKAKLDHTLTVNEVGTLQWWIQKHDKLALQLANLCNDNARLVGEVESLRELHNMQLAGISTASVQNTESTVKDRIDRDNPYWTVAYGDVCVSVDREMRHRADLQRCLVALEEARVAFAEEKRLLIRHGRENVEHRRMAELDDVLHHINEALGGVQKP